MSKNEQQARNRRTKLREAIALFLRTNPGGAYSTSRQVADDPHVRTVARSIYSEDDTEAVREKTISLVATMAADKEIRAHAITPTMRAEAPKVMHKCMAVYSAYAAGHKNTKRPYRMGENYQPLPNALLSQEMVLEQSPRQAQQQPVISVDYGRSCVTLNLKVGRVCFQFQ